MGELYGHARPTGNGEWCWGSRGRTVEQSNSWWSLNFLHRCIVTTPNFLSAFCIFVVVFAATRINFGGFRPFRGTDVQAPKMQFRNIAFPRCGSLSIKAVCRTMVGSKKNTQK